MQKSKVGTKQCLKKLYRVVEIWVTSCKMWDEWPPYITPKTLNKSWYSKKKKKYND